MAFSFPRRARGGFTLVELLVVIAIIVILAGVSMAAYSSAIAHARTAACAGNLRAIGVGLLQFAGDNNGDFPEAGGVIPYNTTDSQTGKQSWTQQLEPYMSGSSQYAAVYRCPDSSTKLATNKNYSYFMGAHAAYHESGGFGAVKLMKMKSPTMHILAGDIAFPNFSVDDADKDDYTQDPAFNGNTGTIPIHGGKVNIVFADGHVETVTKFDKLNMTTVYEGPGFDYLY